MEYKNNLTGKTSQPNSYKMKIKGFLLLMILSISCATTDRSGLLKDDELFVTRKYIGNFVTYRYTGINDYGWPQTVWIKTSLDSIYGTISAYSHRVEFMPGERLYIRRTHEATDIYGYWIYQIENENNVAYKLSEFQSGNIILAQTWF